MNGMIYTMIQFYSSIIYYFQYSITGSRCQDITIMSLNDPRDKCTKAFSPSIRHHYIMKLSPVIILDSVITSYIKASAMNLHNIINIVVCYMETRLTMIIKYLKLVTIKTGQTITSCYPYISIMILIDTTNVATR